MMTVWKAAAAGLALLVVANGAAVPMANAGAAPPSRQLPASRGPAGKPLAGPSQPGPVSAQVPPNLSAMDFLNARTGWVVGTATGGYTSTILRTTDGGQRWAVAATLGATDVLALGFASGLRGWAVAAWGCTTLSGCTQVGVLGTGDGGRSWQRQWHAAMPANLATFRRQMNARVQPFGADRAVGCWYRSAVNANRSGARATGASAGAPPRWRRPRALCRCSLSATACAWSSPAHGTAGS